VVILSREAVDAASAQGNSAARQGLLIKGKALIASKARAACFE
jgi:hypothetical protein